VVPCTVLAQIDRYGAMKSSNHHERRQVVPLADPNRHNAGSRSKRRNDRAAKQKALIVAASKLFASKGYEATTTREIAASAGCAEGLIHRYFSGKAGLLQALLEYRISKDVADLAQHVRPARSLEDECLQLVNWAVEHMWADREFLRVAIPRALLDPSFGQMLRRVGPLQMARAMAARLKKFRECRALPDPELDALAQFVTVMGFMFGFMRPAVLRQDRKTAANIAATIAKLLVRGLPSRHTIPPAALSIT
jgi:TetR/AcrR family transcriptional regulator, regulator of cefoperazone and chloramphenicol sensitivity